MAIPTVPVQRVTIVAESLLEERLLKDLEAAGARGYTLTPARGAGARGVRSSDWEGGNVRIETLVSAAVAQRLLERLAEAYFPHYAVVAWVETVEVVRGDRYV